MSTPLKPSGWEQVAMAIEEVGDRLRRATQTLAAGLVPYAVSGDFAVAECVGRVDRAAVRFTQDIDILLRRTDFSLAVTALEQAGVVYRHAAGIDFFTDGPDMIDVGLIDARWTDRLLPELSVRLQQLLDDPNG